jgi:hypothetical protein
MVLVHNRAAQEIALGYLKMDPDLVTCLINNVAVFLRCSLLTYQFRLARRQRQCGSHRLEKQPTGPADAARKPRYL